MRALEPSSCDSVVRQIIHADWLSMPRFFFHVYNGHGKTPDEVGSDLEDQSAARQLALDSIRSMVSEDARRGMIDLNGRIEVRDGADNLLVTVEFMEAFELRMSPATGRTAQ